MCSQFWPFLFFNFQVCPRVLLDMPCSHPTKYFVGSAGVGPNAQLLSLNSSVWTVGEGKGWAPTQISVQPHIHTISHDNFGESLQKETMFSTTKAAFLFVGNMCHIFRITANACIICKTMSMQGYSVYPVCTSMGPQKQICCCGPDRQKILIDSYMVSAGQQRRTNVGSATLLTYVWSWTHTCIQKRCKHGK